MFIHIFAVILWLHLVASSRSGKKTSKDRPCYTICYKRPIRPSEYLNECQLIGTEPTRITPEDLPRVAAFMKERQFDRLIAQLASGDIVALQLNGDEISTYSTDEKLRAIFVVPVRETRNYSFVDNDYW